MNPARGLPQALLRTCMSVAVHGAGVPHWVVVHDVEGFTAGVYRWPDLRVPVRTGALRVMFWSALAMAVTAGVGAASGLFR